MTDAKVENRLARHGHVSYLEIPAVDPARSAAFYEEVFGWHTEGRGAERFSFDDRSGDLIGSFVTSRAVLREPGILPYLYVDGIEAVVERVALHGGEVITPPYAEGDLWVATFRDPAGNLMGIWQFGPRH